MADQWPGTPFDPNDAPALKALGNAIRGHEHGGPGVFSPQGAKGTGQVMPGTFRLYANPGESFSRDSDIVKVSDRIIRDLYYKHGKDPQRVATGYFSGEGNIAPPGSGQPWRSNVADVNEPVSAYVANVSRNLSKSAQQWPGKPLQAKAAQQWPGTPLKPSPQDPSIIARTKPQAGIEDPSIVARQRPFDPWKPKAPSTPEEKQLVAGEAVLEGAAGKVAQWAQSKLPSWQELKSPDWLYNKLGDITNWTADKVESAAETTFTKLGVPSPQRAARDLTQYLFEFAPFQRGLGVSPPRLAEGLPKTAERIETPAVRPPERPATPTPNHPAAHAAGVTGQDGFLTAGGQFVDRTEAAKVAKAAGQAKPGAGEQLHAEDLKPGTSLAVPARSQRAVYTITEAPRSPDDEGYGGKTWYVNDEKGTRIADITGEIKGKDLHISFIGLPGEETALKGRNVEAGSLGPRKIRSIVDALRRKFPQIETVSGERFSGAHGISAGENKSPTITQRISTPLRSEISARTQRPTSLRQFLRGLGGVKDDMGEVSHMGLRRGYPGLINNKTGKSLDYAREAAEEAGYLPPNSSVADLIDALRKDQHYRPQDAGAVVEHAEARAKNIEDQRLASAAMDVDAFAKEHGLKLDPQMRQRAAEIWRHGEANHIDDAIERAAIQLESEASEAAQRRPAAAGAMATPTHEILAQNTRALEKRLAAEEPTLKQNLRGVANVIRSVTSPEKIIDVETGERSASHAAITIRKALGETTRMAEQMKASADKFYKTFNNMTPEQGLQVIRWIQKPETRALGAYRPTPETVEFMDALAEAMKKIEGELRKLPQTEQMEFRENFLSQMWRDPRSTMKWFQNRAPKTGSNYFTKKHAFDSYEDGIRNDRVPITTNPLEIWMRYAENAFKKIATYKIVAEGREQGRIQYHSPGEQPNNWVELRLPDAHGKKAYAPPGYAEVLNNYLSIGPQGWFGKGIDAYIRAANYANAIKLALSFYHAGLMYNESVGSGFANAIDSLVAGHPLRALAKAGEAPVYPITSIVRARQAIKAYLDPSFGGPQTQRFISALVEANFRFKGKGNIADEYRASFLPTYWDSFRKGRLAIEARQSFANMKQHPIKGPAQAVVHTISRGIETFMAPIFQYAIPRLKVGAVMDMMHTYLLKNPTASDAELAAYGRYASNIVDNRFGEMNQDNIFWRRTQKMAGQAFLVSPSFTFGTIRSGSGAAADTIKAIQAAKNAKVLEGIKDPVTGVYHTAGDSWWTANMSYVPGLVLAMATTGAIVHYLMTGKPPETFKDLQYPQTGGTDPETGQPERAKTPSQLFSMESMINPATTRSEFYNKLKDVPKWIIESLANQDWRGDLIYNPYHPVDQAFAEWMKYSWGMLGSPIYFEARRPEGSAIPESARFFGMTNAPKSVVDPEGSEAKKKWAFAEKEVARQLHNSGEKVSSKERYNRVLDEFYRYQGTQ